MNPPFGSTLAVQMHSRERERRCALEGALRRSAQRGGVHRPRHGSWSDRAGLEVDAPGL